MGLAEILAFVGKLADLGASPAVQSLATGFFARYLGVDQKVLEAAIQASKDAPPPRTA